MTSTIRVAHTVTRSPPEVAGAAYLLNNGSKIYLHGTGVSLIADIAEALNLTVEHKYYGGYNASLVSVANGSADVGSLTLPAHTEYYMDLGIGTTLAYLHPIATEPSKVFFRQPPTSHVQTTIFRPFQTIVWIVILLFNFFTSAVITSAKPTCFSLPFLIKFMVNALHLTVARISLHNRSAKNSPSCNFKARTILVKAFFSVIFIYLYTAKFVSVFVKTEQMVKSPEDLIKYNYTFSSYSLLHIDRIFSKPEIRNIVNARVHPVNVNGFETVDKVIGKDKENPKQALLSLPDGFYPQALFGLKYGKEICQVSSFQSITKTAKCPYIRKDSPFREPINLKYINTYI